MNCGSGKVGALAATTAVSILAATTTWILLQRRRRQHDAPRDLELNEHDDDEPCVYLDYNGTTPVYPFVVDAMMPYLTQHYGNPSSGHVYGDAPAAAIATARRQILVDLLGVPKGSSSNDETNNGPVDLLSSIVFTACGTESDNLAIHWALQQNAAVEAPHIVTCNVEHPAIELCLKNIGLHQQYPDLEVTYVPVGADGRVAAKDVKAAIQSNT